MNTGDLPISIAQYADGTLPAAERARIEQLLAADAQAQSILREEQALTTLLQSDPLPPLDWDALAVRFSSAIDDEMQTRVDRASWALRFTSVTRYFGSRGLVAAAASFILGLCLATYFLRTTPNPIVNTGTPSAMQQSGLNSSAVAVVVDGAQDDQPGGRAVEEVSIGPGGSYATASAPSPYSDEISARPARVMIAADAPAETSSPPASPF